MINNGTANGANYGIIIAQLIKTSQEN